MAPLRHSRPRRRGHTRTGEGSNYHEMTRGVWQTAAGPLAHRHRCPLRCSLLCAHGEGGLCGNHPLSPGRNVTRASQPVGDHLPCTWPRFFGMTNYTQGGAVRNATCHRVSRAPVTRAGLHLAHRKAHARCGWSLPAPGGTGTAKINTRGERRTQNVLRGSPPAPENHGSYSMASHTHGVTNVQHATSLLRGRGLKRQVRVGVRNAPTTVKYICTPVT